MPRLLLFAACERLLFDQHNNLSIISLFQEVRVPPAENIPANAKAPMKWVILSLWQREPSDGEHEFQQECVLLAPDATVTVNSPSQFKMTHRIQRNITTVLGFPIGHSGEHSLILRLDGIEVARHQILVIREEKPIAAS